jgi:choline dehydrogenase-like flavoprotein
MGWFAFLVSLVFVFQQKAETRCVQCDLRQSERSGGGCLSSSPTPSCSASPMLPGGRFLMISSLVVKIPTLLGRTSPFADLVEREMFPGPTVQDDTALMAVIRSTLDTYQHATSTAPMGGDQDASAVVDWLGAVRGVEDLRVVDASIFPEIPSTPTNLTVIMVAEYIAARIITRNLI